MRKTRNFLVTVLVGEPSDYEKESSSESDWDSDTDEFDYSSDKLEDFEDEIMFRTPGG